MKPYYPVFLDLDGRLVLVIGGGEIAQHKVQGLLPAKARLTMIAPNFTDGLRELIASGEIEVIEREYQDGDLEGYDLCMVATDDGAVNAAVSAEGRRRKIWVNAADDPVNCDFILPAVIRRGAITIAASTGGSSPALARRLREELEAYLTEEMPALAELLAEVRNDLRSRGIVPDAEVWQRAIDEDLRVLLAQRKQRQAKTRLLEALGVGELVPELVGADRT